MEQKTPEIIGGGGGVKISAELPLDYDITASLVRAPLIFSKHPICFFSSHHHLHQPRFLHDYVSNFQPQEAQSLKLLVLAPRLSKIVNALDPRRKPKLRSARPCCVNNFTLVPTDSSVHFCSILQHRSGFLRKMAGEKMAALPQVDAKSPRTWTA